MKLAIFKRIFLTNVSLFVIFPLSAMDSSESKADSKAGGGIYGRVKDADDSSFIPYATIALFKEDDSALITGSISDDSGSFHVESIPEGKYYVEINFIGYNKHVIKEVVVDKTNRSVDLGVISLEKAYQVLDEIEISAEKGAIEYRVDKRVINIDKNLQAAGGTVVEALENLPSIQTDAEGNVLLRGSSSFTVLIDGRPTPLSGSEALRQIPAGAVDKVEVITNPSAKFDPDGSAGIINIIMKKEFQNGFNGLVNISAGTAWKRSSDLSFNYRRNKVNYFFSGRYAERPSHTSTEIINEITFNENLRKRHQYNQRIETRNPYAISGGLDYHLNDRNVFSFTGDFGHWGFGLDQDSDIKENVNSSSINIFKHTYTDMSLGGNYLSGVLSHDHNSEKAYKWSSSLFVSRWDGNNGAYINETTLDDNGSGAFSDIHKYSLKTDNYEVRFKSDFSKSLGETAKFEAGYQYRLKDETGAFRYFDFIGSNDEWEENMDLHNNILFVNHIHSLYGTYSGELAGFQYQGGLRAEYTDRGLTSDKLYSYNKIDLFPTVHITRPLPNNQQLQTSYSRRINRPEMWFLNPAPIFSDSYLLQTGNPELVPEVTDSYELNYMRFTKIGFVSAEGYYRQTSNSFMDNLYMQDDGRMRSYYINVGKSYSYGVELSSNLTLSQYLNTYISTNFYNYVIDNVNSTNNSNNSLLRSDFTLNTNIMASKSTRFQVTGFYRSPSVTHQGRISGMYGVNLAVNQEFFNRQMSVTISVRDVFKTMVYNFEAFEESSSTDFTFNMEQQVVMLSLRYRINNYQNNRHREEVTPQGELF